MRLVCWNVNGLRSIVEKGFSDAMAAIDPDIICLQETKIRPDLVQRFTELGDYRGYFSCARRPGYSGIATYVHRRLGQVFECQDIDGWADDEGRLVMLQGENFRLYNYYFPSGTSGDERQDFKYAFLEDVSSHFERLPAADRKRSIICGDFNICHRPIDIHHPVEAEKRSFSGFLAPERAWMDRFAALGFTDTFRHVHGDVTGRYSWWTYRAGARGKNLGWRIDYVFVGEDLVERISGADIHETVTGSDHCPVSVDLGWE